MNPEPLIPTELQPELERLAADGESEAVRRRAQVLLHYQAGLLTREVAASVGLSPRQTRHWRRQFQLHGMTIFAGRPGAPPGPGAPTGASAGASASPLPVDELRARHNPDSRRADHVRALALALFDQAAPAHRLSPEHRPLLATAAYLHDLGASPEARKLTPRASQKRILAQPLEGFSAQEQQVLAATVRLQAGKLQRRTLANLNLAPLVEQETLTLTALLRLALGLDASRTQSTRLERVSCSPHALLLLVKGPHAGQDARSAERAAGLWTRVCGQTVRVVTSDADLKRLDAAEVSPPFPEPHKSPGVVSADPMAEAGRKVLRYHFAEMLRHEQGTRLGEDIEELHDMRVATRRMRAAFEVFGEAFEPTAIKPHLKGLRATGRALGRVRDLDVFMEKATHYLETLPDEEPHGLDPLLQAWAQDRQAGREEMLAFLDSQRYHRFKRDFNLFLATPGAGALPASTEMPTPQRVQEVAPPLIYTRLAAVRAYEPILNRASIDQLHALRIEFKKLRYTVEFFREVLGETAKAVIEDIKVLQDHLGNLNDADVATHILRQFIETWEARQQDFPLGERQNPEPVVAYLAAKHAERHRLMVSFPEAWAHFIRPEFRQALALAVSVL